MPRASVHIKEPFEKRFIKFIASKINTLHIGNISPIELFVVIFEPNSGLKCFSRKRDGMQSFVP